MWHDYGGADWGWMVFGMVLFWLFVLIACIGAIGAFAGGWSRKSTRGAGRSARQLLDERLARGELDVEEYRARCRALDEGGG